MSDVPNPTVIQAEQQGYESVKQDLHDFISMSCAAIQLGTIDKEYPVARANRILKFIRTLLVHIESLGAERDALLAEHEAWDEWGSHSGDALAKEVLLGIAVEAHENAERMIRG